MSKSTEIRIGTSGWHYKHWLGRYYPEGMKPASMLEWYLRDFDSVELNNTFYQLPKESSFDAWRESVPADFRFAVKGSRFITHMIKLKDAARGLNNFLPRAERLGRRLGPILWQLPPGWKVNVERLEEFLSLLPRKHRYAFELRNETWMTDAVFEVLRKYDAAFCVYELAGYHSPMELTANWTYIRLHGPTADKYQGSYSSRQLESWAKRIEGWRGKLDAVYVYFDNDDSAYAVDNALALKQLVASGDQRREHRRGKRAA
jgi:uncharacterized protein YecE (DUF72 family)